MENPKDDVYGYSMLKNAIEQWTVRLRRAGKRQQDLAEEAGITDCHLSQIINFKIKRPRASTLNAVEAVFEKWGV